MELTDRFLRVRGQLRTYRIHLGSGNILMEPNDAYLCIVPGRDRSASSVLLPFEEDGGMLSVILSKAFLLADDTGSAIPASPASSSLPRPDATSWCSARRGAGVERALQNDDTGSHDQYGRRWSLWAAIFQLCVIADGDR
ncbi:hypothetical protein [Nonomuraea sp. NPDC049400]|uniref:DUF7737 domain-containing protein n=1 Tax=Nonomuraea sp. NPDC049400 TaxID=3364352 RepID=UPI00379222CB